MTPLFMFKAAVLWLAMLLLAVVNGVVRDTLLVPLWGQPPGAGCQRADVVCACLCRVLVWGGLAGAVPVLSLLVHWPGLAAGNSGL